LVGKRVRARWRTDATGAVVLTVHYGAKPIEFERGKAAIAVGKKNKPIPTIETVIAAVEAGELDGHAFAQAQLGFFYEQGRGGLPKNDHEAVRLYKLAAEQGDAWALAALKRRGRWQQQRDEQKPRGEAGARARQRRQEEHDSRRDRTSAKMSTAQALEILGLKAGVTEQEIGAAYNRLMKRVHPDLGGSDFFAKQLNAARDALLG
jgi:TPR repeat protein